MKNRIGFRIALAVIGVVSTITGPSWLPLVCMALLAIRWMAWEVLLIGALVDFLWIPGSLLHTIPLYTLAAIILLWGLDPLRKEFLFR